MLHRKIIGQNIRTARLQKRWSQEKLAIRAKMNSDYLSTLERGLVNVSVDKLIKISKALRVPFSELVKGLDT
jgi:transcriptional regulator with XRE-family HTH domain